MILVWKDIWYLKVFKLSTFCGFLRYTYGQPVKGTLSVLFHLKMPRYWKRHESQTTRTAEVSDFLLYKLEPLSHLLMTVAINNMDN